jgi:hypothetical protein
VIARCVTAGQDVRACTVRVRRDGRTLGRRRVRTTAGPVRFGVRLRKPLRRGGRLRVRVVATAVDGAGRRATATRRVTLVRRARAR